MNIKSKLEEEEVKNWETKSINDGQVYDLIPFEKIEPEEYFPLTQKSGEYIRHHYTDYNINRYYGEHIELKNSIAKPKGELDDDGCVYLDIGEEGCYGVVIKSVESNRYWILHYDPAQTQKSDNQIGSSTYLRPNFCDLDPKFPYPEETAANLGIDEKVEVFVIVPNKDYKSSDPNNTINRRFDLGAFYDRIGKARVASMEIINAPNNQLGHRVKRNLSNFFSESLWRTRPDMNCSSSNLT